MLIHLSGPLVIFIKKGVIHVEVYALVGESGTGKSHKALDVASYYQIELILDDGLLIRKRKILAGSSAKKETCKIKAIKRAIFQEEDHANKVKEVLKTLEDQRILVLGTSIQMIHRIVGRLQLPPPAKIIHISQVASREEIALAKKERNDEGRHVIPVPTIEVKRNFPGHFLLDTLQILLPFKIESAHIEEKTIIRPQFNSNGKLAISNAVIKELVVYTALGFHEVAEIPRVSIEGKDMNISVSFDLDLYYGHQLIEVTTKIQQKVKEVLEFSTGIDLREVQANILSLTLQET